MRVGCSLRTVWQEVRDTTIGTLAETTFADLVERAGGPRTPRGRCRDTRFAGRPTG